MLPGKKYSEGRIAAASLQAFVNIANKWNLSENEKCSLIGLSIESFNLHENDTNLSLDDDVIQRISHLIGIYKALHRLLPSEDAANTWMHQVNNASLFNGNSALDQLLSGNLTDFAKLRQYLDAENQ